MNRPVTRKWKHMAPICPYCQASSKLVTGKVIYPHRIDLHALWFYLCPPCNAYVGCHTNTYKPLGRLANKELREAKVKAHAAFDPIWEARFKEKNAIDPTYKKNMARGGRYKKLSEVLGIPSYECHIAMFDVDMCLKTIEVCESGQIS